MPLLQQSNSANMYNNNNNQQPIKLRASSSQSVLDQRNICIQQQHNNNNRKTSVPELRTHTINVQSNNNNNNIRQQLRPSQQQVQFYTSDTHSNDNNNKHINKKKTLPTMVQSRVFRSNAIPYSLRERLTRDTYMWADENIAIKHINDVWEHYDIDNDNKLSRSECAILASDLVDRLLHKYSDMLVRDQGIDYSSAMKVTLRDINNLGLLPHKDIIEAKKIICDRLYRELDAGGDGIVTKTEFMACWPNTCKKYLTIEKPQSMGCNIM